MPCHVFQKPAGKVMIAQQYNIPTAGNRMDFCHRHNTLQPDKATVARKFGIKVSLPPGDTFSKILGDDWERVHWYDNESERDRAFDNMDTRHGYYRTTDSPTQMLEKIIR